MKKFAIPVLMAVIIVAFLSTPALAYASPDPKQPLSTASPRDWDKYAPDGALDPEKIAADSAILMDATTGKVLFAKDENGERYPASTTKIMTCLLALENCKDIKNTKVTVGTIPKADLASDSDHIGLKKGEVLTMEQLLYCLMVKSANDAADAIAIKVGGSISKFVEMMNTRAQELGMTGTHYTCTNGLADDKEHHTTASDMAKLAAEAMKDANFTKIVSTAHYTLPKTNMYSKTRSFDNTNYLIRDDQPTYSYIYAKGIKTGFTTMAGHALVSAAQNGNESLIAVVLHNTPRTNLWVDSITMFEYGFKFYDTVEVSELIKNESFTANIKNAAGDDPGMGKLSLLLKPQSEKAYITESTQTIDKMKTDPASLITSQITYSKDTAPIKRDEAVGTVTFTYDGKTLLTCDLLASRDVAELPPPTPSPSAAASMSGSVSPGESAAPGVSPGGTQASDGKKGGAGSFLIWLGVIALLLVLAMVVIRIVNMQRRSRKYRQYGYRQGSGGLRR